MSASPATVEPALSSSSPPVSSVNFMLDQLESSVWQGDKDRQPLNACLCALVTALDRRIDIRKVLECLPRDDHPFDLLSLLNSMAHIGYQQQTAHLRLLDVEKRLLPCLFMPEIQGQELENEARILLDIANHEGGDAVLTVYDGVEKEIIHLGADDPEVLRIGRAYFFKPYRKDLDPTSKIARQASGRNWFEAVLGRFRSLFVQIFVICLLLNAVALSTPLFIMMVYDRVIASQSAETLSFLVIGVLIAIATEAALRSIRSKSLAWLASRLDNIVNNTTFAQLLGLPPAAIERASVSAQIARIKTFESVRDFFSGSVFLSFLELPFVALALIVLGWITGNLVIVPLIAVGFYLITFYLVLSRVRHDMRIAAKASSARHRFLIETFEKIEGIRANGLTERWAAMYRELSGRECLNNFRLAFVGTVGENVGHVISMLAAAATLGFGVMLARDATITTGALVASMILVWRILSPFQSLCMIVPRLEQLKNSVIQVNNLMDLETEAIINNAGGALRRIQGRLSFQNVAFRYSADQDSFISDLTFEAKPGELVVVTGSNGTGKSSILKLARGLYQPQSGAVRIDGFDLRQLESIQLRRQVAYVAQRPDLFGGTIADNLRLVAPTASDGDLWQSLETVGAAEEVGQLAQQLATPIGNDGSTLSSTLAFRLGLARGFLQDTRLIAIDELPNALLNGSAGQLLKALLIKRRGRQTVLLAAHRADLLRLADRVVLLRHGQTPKIGSPDMIFGLMDAA